MNTLKYKNCTALSSKVSSHHFLTDGGPENAITLTYEKKHSSLGTLKFLRQLHVSQKKHVLAPCTVADWRELSCGWEWVGDQIGDQKKKKKNANKHVK